MLVTRCPDDEERNKYLYFSPLGPEQHRNSASNHNRSQTEKSAGDETTNNRILDPKHLQDGADKFGRQNLINRTHYDSRLRPAKRSEEREWTVNADQLWW